MNEPTEKMVVGVEPAQASQGMAAENGAASTGLGDVVQSVRRGRGRPKGSRNKPRSGPEADSPLDNSGEGASPIQPSPEEIQLCQQALRLVAITVDKLVVSRLIATASKLEIDPRASEQIIEGVRMEEREVKAIAESGALVMAKYGVTRYGPEFAFGLAVLGYAGRVVDASAQLGRMAPPSHADQSQGD
jgi:hypothetical protein